MIARETYAEAHSPRYSWISKGALIDYRDAVVQPSDKQLEVKLFGRLVGTDNTIFKHFVLDMSGFVLIAFNGGMLAHIITQLWV